MTDREKVIRAVETCFDSWIDKHRYEGLDLHGVERMKHDALELLKAPEQIVRCKDCKHAELTFDGKICKYCDLVTNECGFLIELNRESEWFCADGERR